jgi:TonB family protein
MRAHGIIGFAALFGLAGPAMSQTSCAEVMCTAAIPITSHALTADDFPAESIRLGEQGLVRVSYLIGESGDVVECRVTESSGYFRLDEAACAMIRSRWKFKPATANGKPTAQNTAANIVFRFDAGGPPSSIEDLMRFQNAIKGTTAPPESSDPSQLDPGLNVPDSYPPAPSQSSCAPEPCTPAIAITSHAMTPADFPPESLRQGEHGTIAVQYVISETGDVTGCRVTRSSGYPRLDVAACTIIRDRWKYRPATAGGKATAQVTTANVVILGF